MKNPALLLFAAIFCASQAFSQQPAIPVVDTGFSVSGRTEAILYYQFARGDKLLYDFSETNGRALKEVEVIESPAITRFLDYESKQIAAKTFDVQRAVIYTFRFKNTSAGSRNCQLKISRIPIDTSTIAFNTTVEKWQLGDTSTLAKSAEKMLQKVKKKILLLSPINYVLSSTSNAVLKGTKSKIAVPIELPLNTVEWSYTYSVGRDKDSLLQPAVFEGTETCDIYLMDGKNLGAFDKDPSFPFFEQGLQVDGHAGKLRLEPFHRHNLYIALLNPNSIKGICVRLEVTAVVEEIEGTE